MIAVSIPFSSLLLFPYPAIYYRALQNRQNMATVHATPTAYTAIILHQSTVVNTRFEYYQRRLHQLGMTNKAVRPHLETREAHIVSVLRALTAYRPAKVFNLQRWTTRYNTKGLLPFTDAFIGQNLKRNGVIPREKYQNYGSAGAAPFVQKVFR